MSKFPKVIIANIGNVGIKQSYPNITIVNGDIDIHPPDFFNTIYDTHDDGDIYTFLPVGYECCNVDTIRKIVDKLNNERFVGVYTDAYIKTKEHTTRTFAPAYDPVIVQQQAINMPLTCTKHYRPVFNQRIQHMFFGQILNIASHRFAFCHIAEALFNIQLPQISQQIIKHDIDIISSMCGGS